MRGWRTNRKIVVFESDDWGSIRMPSQKAYDALIKNGIPVNKSKYNTLDCLENQQDLEDLFELLSSLKTQNGQHPKITFNTVMQNPNFDAIKEKEFTEFVGEDFWNSYQTYYGENNLSIWLKAIGEGLMQPQFHAKQHLNPYLWLKDLRNNYKETKIAFDYSFFGLTTKTSSPYKNHYLATYSSESAEEFDYIKNDLEVGLDEFEKLFGFPSQTFIACNYTWPKELENTLKTKGIKIIQGQNVQLRPNIEKQGKISYVRHYTGEINKLGISYTTRNIIFEPYLDKNLDWVEKSLKEIENAFFWKKPAIFSTHRINFVGGLVEENKNINLTLFKKLLKKIIEKHPDVEFMTSDELSALI